MKKLLVVAMLSVGLVAGCSLNTKVKECDATVLIVDQYNGKIKLAYKYEGATYTDYYYFSRNDRTVFGTLRDGDKIKVYANQNNVEGVLK